MQQAFAVLYPVDANLDRQQAPVLAAETGIDHPHLPGQRLQGSGAPGGGVGKAGGDIPNVPGKDFVARKAQHLSRAFVGFEVGTGSRVHHHDTIAETVEHPTERLVPVEATSEAGLSWGNAFIRSKQSVRIGIRIAAMGRFPWSGDVAVSGLIASSLAIDPRLPYFLPIAP
jgi:hypothetical protein